MWGWGANKDSPIFIFGQELGHSLLWRILQFLPGFLIPASFGPVKDSLTLLSDFHIHWKSNEHLPPLLPPQPWQEAQDQGELPAHDDVCWYERARLSCLSPRCVYPLLKAQFVVGDVHLNCCTSATACFLRILCIYILHIWSMAPRVVLPLLFTGTGDSKLSLVVGVWGEQCVSFPCDPY